MQLVGLVLFSIMMLFIGVIHESFAEFITSPRHQLESGIAQENIVCKENRVLVLRNNGYPACVTEKTADRTGWEIISQTIQEVVQEQVISESILRKTIVEFNTPESIPRSIIDDHFHQGDKDIRFEFIRYSAKLQELLQPPIIQESTKYVEFAPSGITYEYPLNIFSGMLGYYEHNYEYSISKLPKIGETATIRIAITNNHDMYTLQSYTCCGGGLRIHITDHFEFVDISSNEITTAQKTFNKWHSIKYDLDTKPKQTEIFLVKIKAVKEGGSIIHTTAHRDLHESLLTMVGKTETILQSDYDKLYPQSTETEEVEELLLESVPKPIGDFVAIMPEDQDAFAKRLANAVGEELTNVSKYGQSDYYTTDGRIDMIDEGFVIGGENIFAGVTYKNYKLMKTETEQLEFINNFMEKMGFNIGNNHKLSDEFFDNCEINFAYHRCTFDDVNISKQFMGDKTIYGLNQPYSYIKFVFYDKSYTTFGSPGVKILFNGWTNNPETVVFTLSKQDAVKKAIDFAINDHFLNTIEESFTVKDNYNNDSIFETGSRVCGFQFSPQYDFSVHKFVISGDPYYDIRIGGCTIEMWEGHYAIPTIVVDGLTGDKIHTQSSGIIM